MDHDLELAQKRITELETAIKNHRNQTLDDKCWLDDLELYKVLKDGIEPDFTLPPKNEFLANCERYHASRQPPNMPSKSGEIHGRWMTRLELLEIEQLKRRLAELEGR